MTKGPLRHHETYASFGQAADPGQHGLAYPVFSRSLFSLIMTLFPPRQSLLSCQQVSLLAPRAPQPRCLAQLIRPLAYALFCP